jgi:RNA polymerase sigma-70 factor (ECF subfamily)
MAVPPFNYEAALAACAQGDESAFKQLYQQESPHMLALCTAMLAKSGDAEEMVRDSFMLIWKNADSYDPAVGTARAWIYSIMRYRVLNRLRQSGRPVAGDASLIDTLPVPLANTAQSLRPALVQQLARLDERQRRPILMAFYNGLTYEQIAARLALPIAQTRQHVRAGLSALQKPEQA